MNSRSLMPTGHLRRVEVLPARTHDADIPLIDESHEGIRQIDDKTPNLLPPAGQPLPDSPHTLGALARSRARWIRHRSAPSKAAGPAPTLSSRSTECASLRAAATGAWTTAETRQRRTPRALLPPASRRARQHDPQLDGPGYRRSFYALADKYGLMVWNDFWESTQNYNLEAQDPAALPQQCARYHSALSPSSIHRGLVRAQ